MHGKVTRRATAWATALCTLAAALVIVGGSALGVRHYLVSVVVIALVFVPFAVSFESRRPQARELVVLAVLCALAVASRVVFIGLPSMKPLMGIVMIAGIAFGPQAGFLTGSLSALVSNFIFGQGPWTPWQMLAYGLGGLIAGVAGKAGLVPCGHWSMPQRLVASAGGFLVIVCVVGPVLDTSSLFTMVSTITPASAAAIYLSGLVSANIPHGVATFATLFLLGNPLLKKLNRVRAKTLPPS